MLSFAEVKELLGSIPGAVWAAGLSAAITLLTVNLTEKRNMKRTRDQREHESSEKARDRTIALRREVYLPLAAEFHDAISFLARMPSHTIDEIGKAEQLGRLTSAGAKLALVSSPETAIAGNNLATECSLLYMRFSTIAMEIASLTSVIANLEEYRKGHLTEMERITSSIAAINATGQPDELKFQALQRQFNGTMAMHEQQSSKIEENNAKLRALYAEYGAQFLPAVRLMTDASLSIMAAMRRDLGQDLPGDGFEAQAKANADRIYEAAEAVLRGSPAKKNNDGKS